MRKHDPDADATLQIRAYFHSAAMETEFGRHLRTLVRRMGETDDAYHRRVNQFRPAEFGEPAEPSFEPSSGLKNILSGHEPRTPGILPSEEIPTTALDEYIDSLIALRNQFMTAAQRGNADTLKSLIDYGFPVNYKNPRTGLTALHLVAAYKARKALRVLLKTGKCDFLVRDMEGRLPSEIAFLYGKDPAVARLLGIKERKQAKAAGIKLTHRPR